MCIEDWSHLADLGFAFVPKRIVQLRDGIPKPTALLSMTEIVSIGPSDLAAQRPGAIVPNDRFMISA